MVAVICSDDLRHILASSLPRSRILDRRIECFTEVLSRFTCVVLASPDLDDFEMELRAIGEFSLRAPDAQVIIATDLSAENVNRLAPLRCTAILSLDLEPSELSRRLKTLSTRATDWRQAAATVALDSYGRTSTVRSIVQEVLLSNVPVRGVTDLSDRLSRPQHAIRRAWARSVGGQSDLRLTQFVQWGRRLRAAEMLVGGCSITEAASLLRVDESTLYRDLRGYLSERSKGGTPLDGLARDLTQEFVGHLGAAGTAEALGDRRQTEYSLTVG